MTPNAPRGAKGGRAPAPLIVPNPSSIPAELKKLPRWVAWRSDPRPAGKKPAKVPINPSTGRAADPSDSRTWGTFTAARKRWRDDGLAGIGFVFAGDGIAGVDLDGCRNSENGKLEPWADKIVKEFGTYTEVSPSGTGVKLIVRGRLDPKGRRRNGQIEVYDRSRFFALTGYRLPNTPNRVIDRPNDLSALQKRLAAPSGDPRPDPPAGCGAFDGPDLELLDIAFAARNSERVRALWNGDHRLYDSFSEALLALAQYLVFYTGPDEDRLEWLMLGSPLVAASEADRRKWHTPRRGSTWGRVYVVRKAIESCSTFYSGPRNVGHNAYTVLGSSLLCPSASVPMEEAPRPSKRETVVSRAWAKVTSDLPRALLAYYYSILYLIRGNESGTFCPVVIDSPNQQDQDLPNLKKMLTFIHDRRPKDSQLVLGLVDDCGVSFDGDVIELTQKHALLNKDDYDQVAEEVRQLQDAARGDEPPDPGSLF
jgi:putative DNA primase/helicase